MNLREVVQKYQLLVGSFGQPVALSRFGLSRPETERIFSLFDEDYHISRFFHFSVNPGVSVPGEETYQINGFPQSHISVDGEIKTIL